MKLHNAKTGGRLTLPTDMDIVEQTLELKERLDADALRDCDGTDMPRELLDTDAKIYATYYTTRKDNEWAMENPEEVQQEYLISDRVYSKELNLTDRIDARISYRTVKSECNR